MHFPISTYGGVLLAGCGQTDRDKAKAQGVANRLFGTLQTELSALQMSRPSYVNDFNQFGRTARRVMAPGRGPYRERGRYRQSAHPQSGRNGADRRYGEYQYHLRPDPVIRYNGYPAADLIGDADPRVLSSSQAMTHLEELSADPAEWDEYWWTDLSFSRPPGATRR